MNIKLFMKNNDKTEEEGGGERQEIRVHREGDTFKNERKENGERVEESKKEEEKYS